MTKQRECRPDGFLKSTRNPTRLCPGIERQRLTFRSLPLQRHTGCHHNDPLAP